MQRYWLQHGPPVQSMIAGYFGLIKTSGQSSGKVKQSSEADMEKLAASLGGGVF